MYRSLVFSLLALSTLTLLGIVGTIAWQDYQRHGYLEAGRAFGAAWGRFAEIPASVARLFQSDVLTPTPVALTADNPAAPAELTWQGAPSLSSGDTEELQLQRRFMLGLINADRDRYSLAPLALGDNPAAQWHAEDMMRHNYRSHWGTDGLTPYMRYTLAGGFNRELQNVSGPDMLTGATEGGRELPGELLARTQKGFMSSPEHRANILDRWHRKVNLGIACAAFTCWVVQQFEGDHLRFSDQPGISGGMLRFVGELEDGLELDGVAVWYHRLPQPLTLGQLDATYSYGSGQYPATFLRPPLTDRRYYPDSISNYGWKAGIDPYNLDPTLARIDAPPLRVDVAQTRAVPWTTAARWEAVGSSFRVEADLTPILESSGPGVYTVQIWVKVGEERGVVTNYSVWVR